MYTVAQSIGTHYSSLSGRPDIFLGSGTFKKSGTLLFEKSRVQKNRVIVILKEKRPGCLFSFWITNDPVFLHTAFCNPYFGRIFMSKEDQGDMGSSTVFLIENQWTQKKVIFSNPPFFFILLSNLHGCQAVLKKVIYLLKVLKMHFLFTGRVWHVAWNRKPIIPGQQ